MFTTLSFITEGLECCAPCCLWWSCFSYERAGGCPPCQCAPEDKGVVFFSCSKLVAHMHVGIVNCLYSTQFITLFNCLQNGRTTVHYAAKEGHKEVVELLIDKYNLSATDKDDVS